MERPEKVCARCGRAFAWRKAWARNWERVRYCSDACRARRPQPSDAQLEEAIVALLRQRGAGRTLCPSEAARQVFGAEAGLRPVAMQRARDAARRLVAAGSLDILQKGRVVDGDRARGPIRLRLRRGGI